MARTKALCRDSHSNVVKLVSELSETIPVPPGVIFRDAAEMVIWEQFTRARTREGWRAFDLLTLSKAVYLEADILLPPTGGQIVVGGNSMIANAVPAKSMGAFSNTRCYIMARFGRFARKEKISAAALWQAVERAERGLIDADLGGGVIKQRISRPGAGKSSGYRSIVIYRKDDKAFFVFGFANNAQGNIRNDEEDQFKKAAKITLALTDEQIYLLIVNGHFEEVSKDD